MKHLYQLIVLLTGVLLLLSCGDQGSESLKQAKLDARQKIDQAILEIDEELENMQEKIEFMEGYAEELVKERQQYLEKVREQLDQKADSLEMINEKEWENYQHTIELKIQQMEDSLITWTDTYKEIPEPPVYP